MRCQISVNISSNKIFNYKTLRYGMAAPAYWSEKNFRVLDQMFEGIEHVATQKYLFHNGKHY